MGQLPVSAPADEHMEAANLQHRREVAVNVLEAIDVDQYLIEAVRDARPAEPVKVLNSPAVGRFQVTVEDLESLAGGVVPEWLRYDADAALGDQS